MMTSNAQQQQQQPRQETPTLNSLLQKPVAISAVQNPFAGPSVAVFGPPGAQVQQQLGVIANPNGPELMPATGYPPMPSSSIDQRWTFARYATDGVKNVPDLSQLKAGGAVHPQTVVGVATPFQPVSIRPYPGSAQVNPLYFGVQPTVYGAQTSFMGAGVSSSTAPTPPAIRFGFPIDVAPNGIDIKPKTFTQNSSMAGAQSHQMVASLSTASSYSGVAQSAGPSGSTPKQHPAVAALRQEGGIGSGSSQSSAVDGPGSSRIGSPHGGDLANSPATSAAQMRHSPVSPAAVAVYPTAAATYALAFPGQQLTTSQMMFAGGPSTVPGGYPLPYPPGYPGSAAVFANGPQAAGPPLGPAARFRGPLHMPPGVDPYRALGSAASSAAVGGIVQTAFLNSAAGGYPPPSVVASAPKIPGSFRMANGLIANNYQLSEDPKMGVDSGKINGGRNTPSVNTPEARLTSTPVSDNSKPPKLTSGAKESHPSTPALNSPGGASSALDDLESSLSSPSWPRTPISPANSAVRKRHASSNSQLSMGPPTLSANGPTRDVCPGAPAGPLGGGLNPVTPSTSSTNSAGPSGSGPLTLLQRLIGDSRQHPNLTYQDWEDRRRFFEHYLQFCESNPQSVPNLTGHPTVSKQPVDLFLLYRTVKQNGGYVQCTKKKTWREMCKLFNINQSNSASGMIKKQYAKHVLPYECYYDLDKADPEPIIRQCESKKKHKKAAAANNAAGQQPPVFNSSGMEGAGGFQPSTPGSQQHFHNMPRSQAGSNAGQSTPAMETAEQIAQKQQRSNFLTAIIETVVNNPFDDSNTASSSTNSKNASNAQAQASTAAPTNNTSTNHQSSQQSSGGHVTHQQQPQQHPSTSQMQFSGPNYHQPQQQMPQQAPPHHKMPALSGEAGSAPFVGPPTAKGVALQQVSVNSPAAAGAVGSPAPPLVDYSSGGNGNFASPQPVLGGRPSATQPSAPTGYHGPPENMNSGPGSAENAGPPQHLQFQGTPYSGGRSAQSHHQHQQQQMYAQQSHQYPPILQPQQPPPHHQQQNNSSYYTPSSQFLPSESMNASNSSSVSQQHQPPPVLQNSQLPSLKESKTHANSNSGLNNSAQPSGFNSGSSASSSKTVDHALKLHITKSNSSMPTLSPRSKEPTQSSPNLSNCVEATTCKRIKRRKLLAKDIEKVDLWRLVMALKSGLLFETSWALNVFTILLYDDSTVGYFDLNNMPGFCMVLVEILRNNLANFAKLASANCSTTSNNPDNDKNSHVTNSVNEKTTENDPKLSSSDVFRSKIESIDQNLKSIFDKNDSNDNELTLLSIKNKTPLNVTPLNVTTNSLLSTLSNKRILYNRHNKRPVCFVEASLDRFDDDVIDSSTNQKTSIITGNSGNSSTNSDSYLEFHSYLSRVRNRKRKFDEIEHEKSDFSHEKHKNLNLKCENSNVKFENSTLKCENSNSKCDTLHFKQEKMNFLSREIEENDDCIVKNSAHALFDSPPRPGEAQKYLNLCLSVTNIIRGLVILPDNELYISKHFRLSSNFIQILAEIIDLGLKCVEASQPETRKRHSTMSKNDPKIEKTDPNDLNFDRSPSEDENLTGSCQKLDKNEDEIFDTDDHLWFYDSLLTLTDDAFVILCHLSAYLDLYEYDEKIVENLLSCIIRWSLLRTAASPDFLAPPTSAWDSTTPTNRYALEILCKLTVYERNVDLMLATPPFNRIERLLERLAGYLGPGTGEDPVLREFAIVLLNAFCTACPTACVITALKTPAVNHLLYFLDCADNEMHKVLQMHGMNTLRDTPEIIGTSVGMLRRAASTLLGMAKIPACRSKFDGHLIKYMTFTMSQLMDTRVGTTIAEILYELQKE